MKSSIQFGGEASSAASRLFNQFISISYYYEHGFDVPQNQGMGML